MGLRDPTGITDEHATTQTPALEIAFDPFHSSDIDGTDTDATDNAQAPARFHREAWRRWRYGLNRRFQARLSWQRFRHLSARPPACSMQQRRGALAEHLRRGSPEPLLIQFSMRRNPSWTY